MKELVEYIVKQLVTNPEAVVVEESTDGTSVNLLLRVAPSDMGIVIGKSGQTIKAIRKLLLVKAISDGVRVNLQLFDENRPEDQSSVLSDQSSEEGQSVVGEPETEKQKTEEPVAENGEQKTES